MPELYVKGKDRYFLIRFLESGTECAHSKGTTVSGQCKDHNRLEFGKKFYWHVERMRKRVVQGVEGFLKESPKPYIHPDRPTSLRSRHLDDEGHTVPSLVYTKWLSMVSRCRGYKKDKDLSLIGTSNRSYIENHSVCDEWHDLENFSEWFKDNYHYEGWSLDKDLLSEIGSLNRLYSPSSVTPLPHRLNLYLAYFNNIAGDTLKMRYKTPVGCYFVSFKTRAEKQRFHLYCRVTWIEEWLKQNKGLLDEYPEFILQEKVDIIKKRVPLGFYDNLKRNNSTIVF